MMKPFAEKCLLQTLKLLIQSFYIFKLLYHDRHDKPLYYRVTKKSNGKSPVMWSPILSVNCFHSFLPQTEVAWKFIKFDGTFIFAFAILLATWDTTVNHFNNQ